MDYHSKDVRREIYSHLDDADFLEKLINDKNLNQTEIMFLLNQVRVIRHGGVSVDLVLRLPKLKAIVNDDKEFNAGLELGSEEELNRWLNSKSPSQIDEIFIHYDDRQLPGDEFLSILLTDFWTPGKKLTLNYNNDWQVEISDDKLFVYVFPWVDNQTDTNKIVNLAQKLTKLSQKS